MTLQQLKYAITVAETGTITEAANKLYISQPSLTNAIHELEKEMNIIIFNRTNKGISISKEGEDFLGYARQVLEQAAILEDKYKGNNGGKKKFCVSTQHYSFAVNAFVDLIKKFGQDEYDFSLRETQTYEIIEDVARMRSEIGILFLNDFNEKVITKILKSYDLELLENKEEVAKKIGIGAILFTYLKNSRERDIVFDWKEMLSFDGETGPYVQYSYARAKSILRKAEEQEITAEPDFTKLTSKEEFELAKTLEGLQKAVILGIDKLEPSVVTRYSIEVAKAFNKFYNNHTVLNVEDEGLKAARLELIKATAQVIKNALFLIGIDVVEKM